jgi:peptidoglycan hydrolase-like protein with peptidoglycan-binding domain
MYQPAQIEKRCRRSILLGALLASFFAASGAAHGEGSVRSVQEALRQRGYYPGNPTGNLDEETRGALRRFQIREGLPVTGQIDAATATALENVPVAGVPGPSAGSTAAPREIIPGIPPTGIPERERARSVVQEDREFLANLEDAVRPEAAPKAPVSGLPPGNPPLPEPRQPQREPRAEAPAIATAIGNDDVQRFVQRYIRASEEPTPDTELALYGETVDYFGSGKVSRGHIEKDQREYYRRWPSRDFELEAEPQITDRTGNSATVRYRMSYRLRRGDEAASGQTEHIVRLRKSGDELKIVGIRERKIGRD